MKQLGILLVLLFAVSLHAQEDSEQQVQAPIKKVIGSVRYSDKAKTPAERMQLEDKALDNIGAAAIADYLMGDFAKDATPAQKAKFISQIREYTRYKAFPLIIKYFKDIDLTYEPPVITGDKAKVPSSVVYAGSERLSFTWVLTKVGESFVITDFINKGVSSLQGTRDSQTLPTIRTQGIPGLLATMDKAVAQVKKAAGR